MFGASPTSQTLLLLIACLLPGALHCKAERGAKPVVELPVVEVPGATRIVVTATGIDVDNSAVVESWPREKRDAFVATLDAAERRSVPLVEHEIVKLSSGRVTGVELLADWPGLRSLRHVLETASELEQRFHQQAVPGTRFASRMLMVVDGSVPFETVARVQTVVGQLGTDHCFLQVKGSDGTLLEVPACPTGKHMYCSAPRMTVFDQGLGIEPARQAEAPDPPRTPNVNASTECLSIPRQNGRIDYAEARRLLGHLGVAHECTSATIVAESSRPWSDVAPLAAIAMHSGRNRLNFFIVSPELVGDVTRCRPTVACPGSSCPWGIVGAPLPTGGRPPVPRPPR